MLSHLYIKNYALIESLDIDFHKGFSVITGETGAGKSIILGALSLLLGERADTKAIKSGANRCIIEATYDISSLHFKDFFDENNIEYDPDECIIRRELSNTGKSRAFINDTPVAISVLKILGNQLVDIHSQHQNLLLNDRKFQLKVLDSVAGNSSIRQEYSLAYHSFKEACDKLEDFENNLQGRKNNNDYLLYQLQEIDNAKLVDGEQEELEAEEKIQDNAESIKEALFRSNQLLGEGENNILSHLHECIRHMESLASTFPQAQPLTERLDSCAIELDDIQSEIADNLDRISFDPERQNYIHDRLNLIYTLENKYHKENIEELLSFAEGIRSEIQLFEDSDETLKQLREKRQQLLSRASSLAKTLSQTRQSVVRQIQDNICDRLLSLGMPNIRFEICIKPQENLTPTGMDAVTFLFSANKDTPLQDLSLTGSGGEIARVMLSLKALLSQGEKMQTLIFDEIDTGVSGRIAEKMAFTMKDISNDGNQVISITHLPQIAAKGDYHYLVYKEDSQDATLSHIKLLDKQERINEIAHMLSGSKITEAAISNAQNLINN